MTIWAVLPVKPIRSGKSRLAGVLSEEKREILNQRMFEHTLAVLKEIKEIDKVLVISRDSKVISYARKHGAHTIQEDSDSELNMAVRRATMVAKSFSVQSLLILPADMPLIQPEDIVECIKKQGKGKTLVIAPDRRDEGTNVLFLDPVDNFEYLFGHNSFQFHTQQGFEKGYEVIIVKNEHLALDLDIPEDIELLKKVSPLNLEHLLQNQET